MLRQKKQKRKQAMTCFALTVRVAESTVDPFQNSIEQHWRSSLPGHEARDWIRVLTEPPPNADVTLVSNIRPEHAIIKQKQTGVGTGF